VRKWKKITPTNQLGQVWDDTKNIDDIILDEMVIPVGKTVRVRITSKDVLHNFDIPHFFVKMDAVPGMPTYFKFKAKKTTEEYREGLSKLSDWQVPAEADDPNGPTRWEAFNFELACAELCGKSHFSMKKIVKVVTPEEYNEWLEANESKALYLTDIRGTDADPFIGESLKIEDRIKAKEAQKAPAAPDVEPAPAPDAAPADPTLVPVEAGDKTK